MSKTKDQQVQDALYYLRKPGQTAEDEAKAIEILSQIAFGKKYAASKVEQLNAAFSHAPTDVPWGALKGKLIGIIVGHEPGGGAQGERTYNKKVAKAMKALLEKHGAKVWYYEHKTRSYGKRMAEMKAAMPKCYACIELHYDAVSYPTASGHHFQYRGARGLAAHTRDEFQRRWPQSQARRENGIMKNMTGNGAGFMRNCRGRGMLVEPFFISNPAEKAFFKDLHAELAEVYCIGLARDALGNS